MLQHRQRNLIFLLLLVAALVAGSVAAYAAPQAKPATSQAPPAKSKAAAPPAAQPAAAAPAQAPPAAKAARARPARKAAAKAVAKKETAKATTKKAAAKPPAQQPAAPPLAAGRRDPFRSLLTRPEQQVLSLPAGKKGLVIAQLSIDGIVRGPGGMIAMVSNPQKRTYFLREKDEVYNGHVQKITADGVVFVESAIDPFGKAYTREVTKKLYPVAGEAR